MDESTTVNEFLDEYRKTHGGRKPSIADAFIAGRQSLREFYGAGEIDDLRRQLAEAQAEIATLKRASGDVIDYGRAAVGEAAELRRQLAEAQARVNAADRAVADARRERDAAKAQTIDLRRQLDAARAEIVALRATLARLGDIGARIEFERTGWEPGKGEGE